jgi:hypothetical protein
MSLAKEGSRLITVDGTVYRWRVRKRPTYSQAIGHAPLTFGAEHADIAGAVLLVTMTQDHPSNWIGGTAEPVLPSTVSALIRHARRRGWQPHSRGPAFLVAASDGEDLDQRTTP